MGELEGDVEIFHSSFILWGLAQPQGSITTQKLDNTVHVSICIIVAEGTLTSTGKQHDYYIRTLVVIKQPQCV